MWVARDKDGTLHAFERIPKRFHSGPELDPALVGFSDEIYVENDRDGFWAVQKYYKSNILEPDCRGYYLIRSAEGKCTETYGNEIFRDLTWEDEPVEVELVPRDLFMDTDARKEIESQAIKDRAGRCAVNMFLNPEHYNELQAVAYKMGYVHGAKDEIDDVLRIVFDHFCGDPDEYAAEYENFRNEMVEKINTKH